MNDNERLHPAPPQDLSPAEHEEALKLAEARRLEKLRAEDPQATAREDLPQVHSDDG